MVDPEVIAALDAEAGLQRILAEFGRLMLSEDTSAIQRLVLAESDRFPDLAKNSHADAIVTTHAKMTDYLALKRDEDALILAPVCFSAAAGPSLDAAKDASRARTFTRKGQRGG